LRRMPREREAASRALDALWSAVDDNCKRRTWRKPAVRLEVL
jgi:hypothetical protein